MRYVAGTGERNNLRVTESAGNYVFTDAPTVTITNADGLASPCLVDPISQNIARCPTAAVVRIAVGAGDGDDVVTMDVAPRDGTVIGGGPGYDILSGGQGPDRIYGESGADRIDARGGNDLIDTGAGGIDPNASLCVDGFLEDPLCVDGVDPGQGEDTVSYASRDYAVYVDARTLSTAFVVDDADSTCMTDPNVLSRPECETEQVSGIQAGTTRVEAIIGGPEDDTLIGNKYPNTLIGGPGADILCGEEGFDTVDYSDKSDPVHVTLDGDPDMPTDIKLLSNQSPTLGGARMDCRARSLVNNAPTPPGPGAQRDCVANDGVEGEHDCVGEDVENVIGGSGDDVLIGGDPDPLINEAPPVWPRGMNKFDGGPGDDVLDGKWGPDVFIGGSGDDTLTYAERPQSEPVSATIDGRGNDGSAIDPTGITGDLHPFNDTGDEIRTDVENVTGGAGDDTLAGSEGANVLIGGGGNDDIDGKQGNDATHGGVGDDSVRGGEGDDLMAGDSGNDVLAGDAGTDSLNAGAGNDLLAGGTGPDTLNGGEGIDTVDWASATSSVSVTINGVNDDGTDGEHDYVNSDVEGANGGLADDSLVLGAGDGFIAGGAGNDHLDGGPGADSIEGNAGLDEVDYSSRGTALSVDVTSAGGDGEAGENDDIHDNVEQLRGGPANDMLVGGGFVSVLIGNGGDDQLYGTGGDDQLFGGAGNDGLDGGNDADTLDGGDGDDNLFGSSAGDTLFGGGGNDNLDGGVGPDSISGGGGTDTASYAARSKALNLSFDGNSNDGESGEKDVIKLDVEATTAGRGDDLVASRNGVKNSISCGLGSDQISADTFDEISGDCERIINASPCKPSPAAVTMSKSGVVTIGVSCTDDASGSLLLQTYKPVKQLDKQRQKARGSAKLKAKRVTLGKGSFKLKRGQNTKVKVRLKGSGRNLVRRRKKGLDARAVLTVRQSFGVRSLSLKNGDKLKIKAKR